MGKEGDYLTDIYIYIERERERERPIAKHCHHQNDSSIKMPGGDKKPF